MYRRSRALKPLQGKDDALVAALRLSETRFVFAQSLRYFGERERCSAQLCERKTQCMSALIERCPCGKLEFKLLLHVSAVALRRASAF